MTELTSRDDQMHDTGSQLPILEMGSKIRQDRSGYSQMDQEIENPPSHAVGLRTIAIIEGIKGLTVLLAGFGLLSLFNSDWETLAEKWVVKMHLNPAHHYPHIFIEAASHMTNTHLLWLAAAAASYSTMRFAECIGLWHEKAWAEWFGVLSGGIYLPVEVYEMIRQPTWFKFVLLLSNLLVVGYLLQTRLSAPDEEDPSL